MDSDTTKRENLIDDKNWVGIKKRFPDLLFIIYFYLFIIILIYMYVYVYVYILLLL